MTSGREHIVKSFDQELDYLSQHIARMGGLAETLLSTAVEAMVQRNSELANSVIEKDAELDKMESDVGDRAVHVLALRQPMANDLREVVSTLKISSDLERIGDYAANIAKRVVALNQLPVMRPAHSLPRMARLAQSNIHRVLDAYAERDADKAVAVWQSDEEVDEMYTSLFRETLTYMMEDPRYITPCTHLLFIAKNVERIGDHATNIAETVHFLVRGTYLEGGRPKGDTSSYEVMEPGESEASQAGGEESGEA